MTETASHIGLKVTRRLAAETDEDPLEMTPTLYDAGIDLDAINTLLNGTNAESPDSPITIEFTYNGHRVTVDSTGAVDTTPV